MYGCGGIIGIGSPSTFELVYPVFDSGGRALRLRLEREFIEGSVTSSELFYVSTPEQPAGVPSSKILPVNTMSEPLVYTQFPNL